MEAQKERSAKYEKLIDDLNFQKDEQEKKLEELEAKRAEAETVLSQASSKLSNAQSDQAARLEALRQKAEELAAADGATGPVIDENADTIGREDVVDSNTPVQPNPDPNPPAPAPEPSPDPDPAPSPAPDPGISWSTGIASAYGGSTDPYTPNPGTTANGSVCDDNSMGVAIPMSWPNFRSYFGRTVEISYNGQTVLATVNDCGGMGGGSRSRPAARRMEGRPSASRRARLGSAHGQLPLPVERRDASFVKFLHGVRSCARTASLHAMTTAPRNAAAGRDGCHRLKAPGQQARRFPSEQRV